MVPYKGLCTFLDVVYKERPIQRFWFLETVARMPYFSYISMLHLYETLGGNDAWIDRFGGYHAAILYYWGLNLLWLISPFLAYQFSEMLENHAVDTYSQFLEENEKIL